MTPYPKRLIEVDLPIKRISEHARREKSIRHGHISTLHIWWARRPLAACRAVLCAALWPDPADENCPEAFRAAAVEHLIKFARQVTTSETLRELSSPSSLGRWITLSRPDVELDTTNPNHLNLLRYALLDFIADFANWDASTVPAFLDTARALTQAAHEALGGEPGTRPLVVDPFAGGGAIPLEALRVGADAFASDLNPVAVLLNKVVLEYIPKYGKRLADEVRKRGAWVKEEAEKELAQFYPSDPDGATPVAYLWARTIVCEGPGCGTEVPLLRSLWLAKRGSKSVAVRLMPTREQRRVEFEIIENAKAKDVHEGTVRRGSATCPVCGFTTPVTSVRRQLKLRHGGTMDARLYAVVTTRPAEQGRFYRLPTQRDLDAVRRATEKLADLEAKNLRPTSLIPDEQFTGLEPRRIPVPQYGMTGFGDLFTTRQALMLVTLTAIVSGLHMNDELASRDEGLLAAVQTCLALVIDRQANTLTALSRWNTAGEKIEGLFARQAIPMVWDFGEANPFSGSTGSYKGALEWVSEVCDAELHLSSQQSLQGVAERASATAHPLPDDVADAVVTDPPYYYSVPYSDLSDFFYVWLKRSVGTVHPTLLSSSLTPKDEECVQNLPHSEVAEYQKTREFYEQTMLRALDEARRVVRPDGVGTVVFAHTDTEAWEALLTALVGAGWRVTASWPIDTEMASRVLARRQSTLASSIHLVCRPRENADGSVQTDVVGDWRDVLQELPPRIHDWLPRLADEGVVGADAIFACLGPALEIFSRYSRVEKANGDVVTLKEYLEHVWAAVSREALTTIFRNADATGFEPAARLTAMMLWTLNASLQNADGAASSADGADDEDGTDDEDGARAKVAPSGCTLEYDAARKIAQGLGAHLEKLDTVVQVKGDKARLLPVAERARYLFGKDEGAVAVTPRSKAPKQVSLFPEMGATDGDVTMHGDLGVPTPGSTVLDRVHQAMLLFAAGRGDALKRFVVDQGIGGDQRFWKLAQALSALYPKDSDEKRWVDGVLARKKALGF